MARFPAPSQIFIAFGMVIHFVSIAEAQSDPSNFDTVINAPPTVIANGEVFDSNTQLNLLELGSVEGGFRAGNVYDTSTNIEVNVSGGTSIDYLTLRGGVTLNLFDGQIGDNFFAQHGAEVNVLGGEIGGAGRLRNNSTLNVAGGHIGNNFTASNTTAVNLFSGSIGAGFLPLSGSQFDMSGGELGSLYTIGGAVNISGGIAGDIKIRNSPGVSVSGGFFEGTFASDMSNVTLVGSEFLLNNEAVANPLSLTVSGNSILTGTLADGSPFAFSPIRGGGVEGIKLQEAQVPDYTTTPILIASPLGIAPRGLRAGQSLTLQNDGALKKGFVAIGSTVAINGGTVGNRLGLVNSVATISDGVIGDEFGVLKGSHVTISGGTIGDGLSLFESDVNLSGGVLGDQVTVLSGATLNVSGGQVGREMQAESGGTVNLTGGSLAGSFGAQSGGEVNVSGGTVDGDVFVFSTGQANVSGGVISGQLRTYGASEITLSGGQVDGGLRVRENGNATITGGRLEFTQLDSGAAATISGGHLGKRFAAAAGSSANLIGGEFVLNGEAVTGSDPVTLSANDVLSGTLEDGNVFVFSPQNYDEVVDVSLQAGVLPALVTTPIVVTESNEAPAGLRSGQSLTLESGGSLGDHYAAVGSTVTINGGVVGKGLELSNSELLLSNGIVGERLRVYAGTEVTVTGGEIGYDAHALAGSTFVLEGGRIGDGFSAASSSVVNINNGSVGDGFVARLGSEVTISGGKLGQRMWLSGNQITIRGGEFLVNGAEPADLTSVSIADGDLLTGTLEDGSVFLLTERQSDLANGVNLVATSVPAPELNEIVIAGGSAPVPNGLRNGQTLVLQSGGTLPDAFEAVGATVNIQGGSVGEQFSAVDTNVNISGGNIGRQFTAFSGTNAVISGGRFDGFKVAEDGSQIELQGSRFYIDDVEITQLTLEEALLINDRDVKLNAILADGSPIAWSLLPYRDSSGARGFFSNVADLLVTKVSDQLSIDVDSFKDLFGLRTGNFEFNRAMDLDSDGAISLADYDLNMTTLVQTPFGPGTFIGDLNLDGDVDVSQIVGSGDAINNVGDASILLANLGMTSGALHADGDLNGDGDVDVTQIVFVDGQIVNVGDASRLLANLGQTKASARVSTAAVPEPASLAVFSLTVIAAITRRWR